jgi:hypothetical protein
MTLYVGLRNYTDIQLGLRVRKDETIEVADADAARLPGDVIGPAGKSVVVPAPMPQINNLAPEPDIEIDLGADDLSQKPNRKRTAQKDRT